MSPRLATTRLVKVRGEHRWTAVPAYAERASSPEELAELFHRAQHELTRSSDPALGPSDRFRAAAEAAAAFSTLVLRASGYETVPPGDSRGAIEALPTLFGAEGRAPAAAFLAGYRKSRRKTAPGSPATVERQLRTLMTQVERFRKAVLEWFEVNRRPLPPAPKSAEGSEPTQGLLF